MPDLIEEPRFGSRRGILRFILHFPTCLRTRDQPASRHNAVISRVPRCNAPVTLLHARDGLKNPRRFRQKESFCQIRQFCLKHVHRKTFRSPSMIADDVQSGFPNGVALPQGIHAVCDNLDEHGYPIGGCFEINLRGRKLLPSWFRNDEQMKEQFAVIGNGSTGSTYALWLRGLGIPNRLQLYFSDRKVTFSYSQRMPTSFAVSWVVGMTNSSGTI